MRIQVFFVLSAVVLCSQATFYAGSYGLNGFNYGSQRYPIIVTKPAAAAYTIPTVASAPVSAVAYNPLSAVGYNPVSAVGYNPVSAVGYNPLSAVAYNPVSAVAYNPVSAVAYNPVTSKKGVNSYPADLDNYEIIYDTSVVDNTYGAGKIVYVQTSGGLTGLPLKK